MLVLGGAAGFKPPYSEDAHTLVSLAELGNPEEMAGIASSSMSVKELNSAGLTMGHSNNSRELTQATDSGGLCWIEDGSCV